MRVGGDWRTDSLLTVTKGAAEVASLSSFVAVFLLEGHQTDYSDQFLSSALVHNISPALHLCPVLAPSLSHDLLQS